MARGFAYRVLAGSTSRGTTAAISRSNELHGAESFLRIRGISWNPKVQYRVHRFLPLRPILSDESRHHYPVIYF
jgi:hypothetical protein